MLQTEVKITFFVIMSRKEDVHAAEMRRGAQGSSTTHIGLLHNAQKWCMTLAAPLYLPFVDGGSVDFLHRCFAACRFYWIAPDLYERRIAGKPLSLALLQAIACHSSSATGGPIHPDILDHCRRPLALDYSISILHPGLLVALNLIS